jgi:four helix bundle protein
MAKVSRVGDLKVYRRLTELHLRVHEVSLTFPKFELYELGSQLRRASNSAPANIAEGFNNKHRKIYLESISRSLGEIRETRHHLMIARRKGYVSKEQYYREQGSFDIPCRSRAANGLKTPVADVK